LLPNLEGPGIEIPYFDKLVHAGFYFVASFLFLLLVEKTSLNKLSKNIKVFTAIVLHLVLGGMIEYLQHFYVSGRSGEIADIIANLLGVLAAIIIYYSKWNYFYRPN
jgi:VanZ family protein